MALNLQGKTEISGVSAYIKTTANGELVTADITRVWTAKGYGKQAMATAAVASLVVRPTTTAIATLYNSGAANVLVIERVFAHNLVAVASSEFNIWLCVHPTGMTAPTNDITVRNSTSGKVAGGSSTIFDNGATVNDDGWFPWMSYGGHTVAVTTPGDTAEADIRGRIVVPYSAGLSVSVVGTTTSVTTTVGIHWFEVPLTEFAIS